VTDEKPSNPDLEIRNEGDAEHQSAERQSFLELTRSIASLPLDQAAAALETSAAIASISSSCPPAIHASSTMH